MSQEIECKNDNNLTCVLRRMNSNFICLIKHFLKDFYEIYRLAFNEDNSFIYGWANDVIETIKHKLPKVCKTISETCESQEKECPYTEDSNDIECGVKYTYIFLNDFLAKIGVYLGQVLRADKWSEPGSDAIKRVKKLADEVVSLGLESIYI